LRAHASIFYGFSAQNYRETTGWGNPPSSRAGKGIAADREGLRKALARIAGKHPGMMKTRR
jgi:hypothetical protein